MRLRKFFNNKNFQIYSICGDLYMKDFVPIPLCTMKKVSQYLYVFKVLYTCSYILNTGMFSVHVFHKGLGVCDQQEIYYRGTQAKHYLTLEMTSD